MEKFILEIPSINRKKDALEYLNEMASANSEFNGLGGLDKCIQNIFYEEWLIELENKQKEEYANDFNRVLSKTYFVVRQNDNKIVGMVNIRYNISQDKLKDWASHIGYSIRPTERRKGYSKIALYLSLLEEQKMKEDKVLLVCDVSNVPSNKTILALGGTLEKSGIYKYDNVLTNYYWIDVNDSLNRYYECYKDYIGSKKDD